MATPEEIHHKLLMNISDCMPEGTRECKQFIEEIQANLPEPLFRRRVKLVHNLNTMENKGYLGIGKYEHLENIAKLSRNTRVNDMIEKTKQKLRALDQRAAIKRRGIATGQGSSAKRPKSSKVEIGIQWNSNSSVKQCLSKVSPTLMKDHSNIEIVTACSVKSKDYKENTRDPDLSKETCIVLYVHVKGIVPLQEDVFPKHVRKFPVDVREGCFMLYGKPSEYHDYLKMGCAIGRKPHPALIGTLSAFYERNHETLCLTSAHVLLTAAEMKTVKTSDGKKTYDQSSIGVLQPVREQPQENDRFGELYEAHFDTGGEHNSGVEISVVKIQSRDPVAGDFPDGDLEQAGYDAGQPMVYNNGKILPVSEFIDTQDKLSSEVVKYGCMTGVTRGTFALVGPSVRKAFPIEVPGYTFELQGQIEVYRTGHSPFAAPGDSGALVFGFLRNNPTYLRPIGILEGGTTYGTTIVTPISAIMKKLGINQFKCFNPESTHRLLDAKLATMREQMNESINDMKSHIDNTMANKDELKGMEERLVQTINRKIK